MPSVADRCLTYSDRGDGKIEHGNEGNDGAGLGLVPGRFRIMTQQLGRELEAGERLAKILSSVLGGSLINYQLLRVNHIIERHAALSHQSIKLDTDLFEPVLESQGVHREVVVCFFGVLSP
jgi:hypothetical protein